MIILNGSLWPIHSPRKNPSRTRISGSTKRIGNATGRLQRDPPLLDVFSLGDGAVPARSVACASNAPTSMRVSWPVRSARTRAWSRPGFAGAVGGRRASAFRRSVLAETISQESTKLRIIITIHAVQAAETNQASGMVVTPVVKVRFALFQESERLQAPICAWRAL